MCGYVYILSSKNRSALYIGVTSNLIKRVWEHKMKVVESYTENYNADRLVYYEVLGDMETAIAREKQLKNWRRSWKEELIESMNPNWNDLYYEIL